MELQAIRITFLLAILLTANMSHSAIISITTGDTVIGNRSTNLITNGSFENITLAGTKQVHPGFDIGWTPGSVHLGNYPIFEVPSIDDWTSSYGNGAYGSWGPLGLSVGVIPDGNNVVYFGNSFAYIDNEPDIAANGEVTNVGAITNDTGDKPVTLLQSVDELSIGATYTLDFWTTGELNTNKYVGVGFFGVEIGGDLRHLLLPNSSNSFGATQRFQLTFTADDTTTDIKFYNWGHISILGENELATELILDDIILNASPVPLPSSAWMLCSGLIVLIGAGKTKRH